mgnify:CR=1 FL=1
MSVHPPVPVQLSVHDGVQFVLHLSSEMMHRIILHVIFSIWSDGRYRIWLKRRKVLLVRTFFLKSSVINSHESFPVFRK